LVFQAKKEGLSMFCSNCGSKNDDASPFCGNCGARLNAATAPVQAAPPQAYAPPPPPPQAYAPPPQAYAPPSQYAPAPPPPAPKKKHGCLWGCLIVFVVVLVAVGVVAGLLFGAFDFIGGPGYSQKDYDSAMQKIGLQIDFLGLDDADVVKWLKDHKGQKVALADYDIQFSGYEEREFSLTQAEANAFVNGVAPNFSWFDSIKFTINEDGSVSGKYKVDFKKVKDELIPDLLGDIPPQISSLLPNQFSLTTKGTASIVENQVVVPEPLETLNIGPIPLQPIIKNVAGGSLDEGTRQEILDVTARIYTQIPELQIHFLGVENGQFKFSGYMPTQVTVTEK